MRAVQLSFVLLSWLASSAVHAQTLNVGPYVQDARPTSAWILWETTSGEESRVEWGVDETLGAEVTGTAHASEGEARVHEVQLTGLTPATRYHYRVHTGTASSDTFFFTTPALASDEAGFRVVFVSDMQRDDANPDVYRRVMQDGVMSFLADEGDLDRALAFVVLPGDLVENGLEYPEWRDHFFEPGAPLMRHVPFYPTLGNHERDAHYYYDYFHLPESGVTGENAERWWHLDHGNVRVIGLDSNRFVLLGEQEEFLDASLASACTDDAIDFVFVALHHANVSELWPAGQAPLAATVAERMDAFGRECGKGTAQLYGHTHAYSRGASREARHLWVNVASAGGNLDYFGEYGNQYDSDAVDVSQDEWGFVLIDVTAGADPTFRLRRVSLGNEMVTRENEVRDELTIRRYDEAPMRPVARAPRGRVTAACTTLRASDFVDPDGDLHGATRWQVAERCDELDDAPIVDRIRSFQNWYGGVDTQAGDDLSDEPVLLAGETPLVAGDYRCWRVRHRDRGLAWSEWSEPIAFLIDEEGATPAMGCDDPSVIEPPTLDAGVDRDAGVSPDDAGDAGELAIGGGGCACRAGSGPTRRAHGHALLGALVLALAARRGSARARGRRSRHPR